MPNNLLDLYNWGGIAGSANSTPMISPKLQTQILPNGGGSYNPAGTSAIAPAPIFTGIKPTPQIPYPKPTTPQRNFYKNGGSYYYADTNQKILDPNALELAAKSGVEIAAPEGGASFTPTPGLNYDKYKDPKTGKILSPEEWAVYLGNKIPKGNGEITNYASDALANPNQTASELTGRATDLNNSRNDIVSGTTDPYNIASKSGIPYSGAELKAIENAYAGVYDPVLQDVFARLKTTQEAEKQKTDLAQAKEMEIFKTNESIRQWRATTGTTPRTSGPDGKEKPVFTQLQLNNGAINAGMSLSLFDLLDEDIKNFYINTPMGTNDEDKKVPMYELFAEDYKSVLAGDLPAEQLSSEISSSSLSPAVKQYFISQIPAGPEEKDGWIKRVWGAITSN
jgi:hypothetical protein